MPHMLWLQHSKSKVKNTQFTLMSNENSSGAGKKFLLVRDGRASSVQLLEEYQEVS